jgi:hypothetical protein
MAQILITDQQVVAESHITWIRTILLGMGTGLLFWLLTVLIGHYVIEPLTCRQVIDAAQCTNATPLAGNISAIFVAILAIFTMIRIGAARPIIVAVASAAILWSLASWTQGLFWLEAIGWSVLLYGLAFALFSWITRHPLLWVTLVLSAIIVLAVRIAAIL